MPIPILSLDPGYRFDQAAWLKMWRATPGSPNPRCVKVGNKADFVRSGQFRAGDFTGYTHDWNGPDPTGKFFWFPLYPDFPDFRVRLRVTAERLDAAFLSAPKVIVYKDFEMPYDPNTGISAYVTHTLPTRGRWRLRAVAGRNVGCFDVKF